MGKPKKKFKVLKEGLGVDLYSLDNALFEQNLLMERLREENKKLKEELKKDNREVQVDVDRELLKANDYLIKENKKLKEEIKKLKAELEFYKKQYKHSMGEDYIDKDLYDLDC